MRRRQLVRLVPALAVLLALAVPLGIDSGQIRIGAAETEEAKTPVVESGPARLDAGPAAIPATRTEEPACKRDPADASAPEGEMPATLASLQEDMARLGGTAVGIALQVEAYEAAGEAQEKARALRRRGELEKVMRENHGGDVESLLFRDANVVSRFVEEFAAHGEFAAMRLVRGEAERLKATLANSRVSGSATHCFDQRLSPDGIASADTAPAVGAPEEAPHEVSR